jgi:hypothetical protein
MQKILCEHMPAVEEDYGGSALKMSHPLDLHRQTA